MQELALRSFVCWPWRYQMISVLACFFAIGVLSYWCLWQEPFQELDKRHHQLQLSQKALLVMQDEITTWQKSQQLKYELEVLLAQDKQSLTSPIEPKHARLASDSERSSILARMNLLAQRFELTTVSMTWMNKGKVSRLQFGVRGSYHHIGLFFQAVTHELNSVMFESVIWQPTVDAEILLVKGVAQVLSADR
ncbi:hypothetical protein F9817_03645 [Vibrio sp. CAIM 722]|uniref:Uncharacterized protein n=1 Tax=Vibrio eleionomae TaxID=2653505 RepID=A0A7X4LIC5_9VIBR|nr:hypothetical protein [Vibrio eleionomae]MZI92300.1 hypothetical protein [Vibrio eleionomae]